MIVLASLLCDLEAVVHCIAGEALHTNAHAQRWRIRTRGEMLSFTRRKSSADTSSTSPTSTDSGDEMHLHSQLAATTSTTTAPAQSKKKKRQLSLLTRLSKESADENKDATALLTTSPGLASHVVWKLAMRMSLHNESRFLQHLSRSMLSYGAPHKVPHRIHELRMRVSSPS